MKRPLKAETGIYLITNTVNNKVWVGQATGRKGVQGRVTNHLSKFRRGINSPHLQAAWNKWGCDAFVFEVLMYCSVEQCDYWEDFYIDVFGSWQKHKGYNLDRYSRGGGPRTAETLEKIRVSNEPHRARVLRILQSDESRVKAIQARRVTCADPAWRQALSETLREVYKDPSKRQQRSETAKEVQNRPEVKEKLKKSKTGRVWCNNGSKQKFVKEGEVPEGWVLGSLVNRATCSGRTYYTNKHTGQVKRFAEPPDEEGWVVGRNVTDGSRRSVRRLD